MNDFLREDFFAAVEPAIFDATLIDGHVDPQDGATKTSHLLFQSPGTVWQLWVGHGDINLPKRLVITYTGIGRPEFAISFEDWSFDSDPGGLGKKYGIPTNLDDWTMVEFVNPINFK